MTATATLTFTKEYDKGEPILGGLKRISKKVFHAPTGKEAADKARKWANRVHNSDSYVKLSFCRINGRPLPLKKKG
ncbi:MAG: hypothetical protein DWQ49_09435 [Bacteroidetes bacterium]|nr:MAG: hypothetical protein DWQ49_09435 [Bacteroidota bacterium]